jgi:hypothetical protein
MKNKFSLGLILHVTGIKRISIIKKRNLLILATSGKIQLVERCRVYNRQYIKCIIRAPTLARAIQNNFLAEFQFTEITRL